MASYACNEIKVSFNDDNISEQMIEVIFKRFKEELTEVDIHSINDDNSVFEASFQSRWSEPKDFLVSLCNEFDLDICGVCWEFGNDYVNSFHFRKT